MLAFGGHHAVVLEFLIYLIGFVADVIDMALRRSGHESPGFALVTAAEHTYFIFVLKLVNDIFSVGCLSGAAHGDIADGNYRDVKLTLLQQATVKHHIAHSHHPPVNFAYGIEQ